MNNISISDVVKNIQDSASKEASAREEAIIGVKELLSKFYHYDEDEGMRWGLRFRLSDRRVFFFETITAYKEASATQIDSIKSKDAKMVEAINLIFDAGGEYLFNMFFNTLVRNLELYLQNRPIQDFTF